MKKVQILGIGCPRCKKLAEQADAAARELGIQYELVKVTDISEIQKFRVLATPALAVDGQVKAAGRIPSVADIKKMLAGG